MISSHKLANKLEVIHLHQPHSTVTHCAVMIKAGARDEPLDKTGLAHFIEHTLFKGTQKRKSFHVINNLDSIGGELNAFTTKEETCIHASVMSRYEERATELIADILFNSTFPKKEIEKEKTVIIDEIHAYEDNPYEQIYDDFEQLIFKNHSLGSPILGSKQHIHSFLQKDITVFMKSKYDSAKMIWIVSTPASSAATFKLAEKYFSGNIYNGKLHRRKPVNLKPVNVVCKKPISQFHHICGRTAYSLHHENRFALSLLNNILGGPAMNSRLNITIREKYGYTYAIESGYNSLSDTGLFHIYFATDAKYFEKTKSLAEKELFRMMNDKLTATTFDRYKKQLLGQMTMGYENKLNVILAMAKSYLNTGKWSTLTHLTDAINSVSITQFKKVATEICNPAKLSSLTFEPEK